MILTHLMNGGQFVRQEFILYHHTAVIWTGIVIIVVNLNGYRPLQKRVLKYLNMHYITIKNIKVL